MKSMLIVFAASCMILASCGSNSGTVQDSANAKDSVAAVESARQDSIAKAELEESYANAIDLKVVKSTFRFNDESSLGTAKSAITLTNNTKVNIDPSDYVITYSYPTEVQKGDELCDAKLNNQVQGPALPAGETVEFTIKQGDATAKILKPGVKMVISKEDFIKKAEAEK